MQSMNDQSTKKKARTSTKEQPTFKKTNNNQPNNQINKQSNKQKEVTKKSRGRNISDYESSILKRCAKNEIMMEGVPSEQLTNY